MPSFYLASSHPGSIACSGLLQEPSLAIGLQGGMRPLLSEVTDPRPAREQDMLGKRFAVALAYGKVSLVDEKWNEVADDAAKYNFFKVAVEMK